MGGSTSIATGGASSPSGTRSAGCNKTTTLKSGRASITVPNVADTAREYILTLPTNYDPSHAYRLVFAWHPWTGTAQMIQSGGYYGLQKEANNEAIFVAGDGLVFTQGSQSGPGWGNKDGEDVAFYHTMLDLFRSELCIDEDRIFSVGFSFGAMFSFTLGCTADSMLRAIVPMAGNTFTSGGCASGSRSVAVMAFIGLQDSLLDGHRQAVSSYATRDGCTTTTQTITPSWCDGLNSSNLPCTCVNYQGCKDGYPVVSCEYTAGHQQAPNPGPIWDFIAQF
jgi:poly(3-hydroxybutyrate) depolymerase